MNVSEHIVQNADETFCRKVWLLEPAGGYPQGIAIFLDGEFYVHRMDAPATLHELQSQGELPPLVCVFVSHVDGAARHLELTCNLDFAGFIAKDVIAWLRQRYSELSKDGHLICGPSLGGLASAFTALNYPEVFSRCLSQSGSFWWNDEWLTSKLGELPPSQLKIWFSVGDHETSAGVSHAPTGMRQEVTQIAACERFAAAMQERHHTVHHRVYEGGHDIKCWQAELPDALRWLLSASHP